MLLTIMPPLENPRHEIFAQELVKAKAQGRTQAQAYQAAGYASTGDSARAAASRMICDRKNGIQDRVIELLGRGAAQAEKRVQVNVNEIFEGLDRNIKLAERAKQHSAVNGAYALKAQLGGLVINRTEVASAGGFEGLTSVEDVINKVREESGQDAADAVILAISDDRHEKLVILDRMRDRIASELADLAHDVGVSVGIDQRAMTEREQDQ